MSNIIMSAPPFWYNGAGNLVTAPESSTDASGLSIGYNATAKNGSTVVGNSADAEGNSSCVVVGASAKANKSYSVVIGAGVSRPDGVQNAEAKGANSVVIGAGAYNTSGDNVVIGTSSYAAGDGTASSTDLYSVVVGYNSNVNGLESVVVGSDCSVYGNGDICIGYGIKIGADGHPANDRIQIGKTDKSYDVYFGNKKLLDFDLIYPVGSIYMSVSPTDPETLFGGKWERWGQGRVPVGVNENDEDFNTAEKTGGEKAHKLTISEMPAHTHNVITHTDGANTSSTVIRSNTNTNSRLDVATTSSGGGPIITYSRILPAICGSA